MEWEHLEGKGPLFSWLTNCASFLSEWVGTRFDNLTRKIMMFCVKPAAILNKGNSKRGPKYLKRLSKELEKTLE